MVELKELFGTVFSYYTSKVVNIKSPAIGLFSRSLQLAIFLYVICYAILYKKGYQEFCGVRSSVITKVKGIAFTNFSEDEFNPEVLNPSLYNRIWDTADYVVPPSQTNAVFVTTNIEISSKQTLSTCPEDPRIPGAICDPDNNTCVKGHGINIGNGIMTGKCIPVPNFKNNLHSCEIMAWCPVEVEGSPLKKKHAILGSSENFTLLIKNVVHFPKFKGSRRRNIKTTSNKTYLQTCYYSKETPDCPIFVLGEMVKSAGFTYENISYKGGVISILIEWNCDLDWDKSFCLPVYSFARLDKPTAVLAAGYNFRYANYYSDTERTLFKAYGIKFDIFVRGQAGKFSMVPLLLNVGAGLGLLAIQVIVCDIVILYLVKGRHYYTQKKYERVILDDDEH